MFTLVLGFREVDDPEPTDKYLTSTFYNLFRSLCKTVEVNVLTIRRATVSLFTTHHIEVCTAQKSQSSAKDGEFAASR